MKRKFDNYNDGLDMEKFKNIESISYYCHNYHVGFGQDLLYGKSDDDNTTEWWIVKNETFYYLGESYVSNHDFLHRYDSPQT